MLVAIHPFLFVFNYFVKWARRHGCLSAVWYPAISSLACPLSLSFSTATLSHHHQPPYLIRCIDDFGVSEVVKAVAAHIVGAHSDLCGPLHPRIAGRQVLAFSGSAASQLGAGVRGQSQEAECEQGQAHRQREERTLHSCRCQCQSSIPRGFYRLSGPRPAPPTTCPFPLAGLDPLQVPEGGCTSPT